MKAVTSSRCEADHGSDGLFGIRGALVASGLLAPAGALLALSKLRGLDARMHTAGENVAPLQRVAMLAPLPLATITQLTANASSEVRSAGALVIREGTPGEDF